LSSMPTRLTRGKGAFQSQPELAPGGLVRVAAKSAQPRQGSIKRWLEGDGSEDAGPGGHRAAVPGPEMPVAPVR